MATTIHEVAKLAGVSIATVSRVMNDARNVSSGTRTRVSSAIAELHFRPNIAAIQLSRTRKRVGGVRFAIEASSND